MMAPHLVYGTSPERGCNSVHSSFPVPSARQGPRISHAPNIATRKVEIRLEIKGGKKNGAETLTQRLSAQVKKKLFTSKRTRGYW